MSLTTKFVRKPFYVEAVQVTEENMAEVARWCNGTIVEFDETENVKTAKYIKVRVHHPQSERQTKAFVDDYVLYAGKGYKCYTQKAFLNTFQDLAHKAVEVPQPVIAAESTPVVPKPQPPAQEVVGGNIPGPAVVVDENPPAAAVTPEEPVTVIVDKEPESVAPGVEATAEVAVASTDLCATCGVTRAFHDNVAVNHPFGEA